MCVMSLSQPSGAGGEGQGPDRINTNDSGGKEVGKRVKRNLDDTNAIKGE